MAEFRFTQTYDLERQVNAYEVHLAARRSAAERRNVFIVIALALLIVSWLAIGSRNPAGLQGFWPWILLSMGLAALAAWSPASWRRGSLRRQVQSQWDRLGLRDRQTVYSFDDDRILIEDDFLGGKVAWNELTAWHDGTELLLFYRAPELFYFIDKSTVDTGILKAFVERLSTSPAKRI